MHTKKPYAWVGLLIVGWIGCTSAENTNKTTTSSSSSGGSTQSGGAGGIGVGGAGAGGFGEGGQGSAGNGVCPGTYEDCTTPADDNCDGDAPTCSGDGLWAKAFGDAEWGDVGFVATDAGGNVFVATNLLGMSIDFGGGALAAQGADVTLAKLDANGNHLWSQRYGDPDQQVMRALCADHWAGVVIGGSFKGSIDFGGGALVAPQFEEHPFVARIDGTGKQVFSRSFSGSNSYQVHAVAAHPDGGVVIGGCGDGAVDFGVGMPPQAAWSGFVARLSPTGQTLWARTFTSPGPYVCVEGVGIDNAGNVVATGVYEGTVDLGGGGPITSAGGYDAFVVKLDNAGTTKFRISTGGAKAESGVAIDFDPAGDIVVLGTYQSTIDFGTGPLVTMADTSAFVAKLDPTSGQAKWQKAFGGAASAYAHAMLVDPAGHILLTGGFFGTVDFDDGPVTSQGYNDLVVAKLDGTGKLLWKKVAGDGDIQEGGSLAVDSAGHVFLGGRIWGAVDLGTGSVATHGKDDALVAKLKP